MRPRISLKSNADILIDSTQADMGDRISEPEKKAPWAISLAMAFTYIAGFLFNIVLCFCMVGSCSFQKDD